MLDDGRLAYEDIAEDLAWETPGITVTESHIFAFAGLSGDFYEIHVDDDYARALGYPGRVAHGLLGLALAESGSRNGASIGGTLATTARPRPASGPAPPPIG